jgi:hypothetical protein
MIHIPSIMLIFGHGCLFLSLFVCMWVLFVIERLILRFYVWTFEKWVKCVSPEITCVSFLLVLGAYYWPRITLIFILEFSNDTGCRNSVLGPIHRRPVVMVSQVRISVSLSQSQRYGTIPIVYSYRAFSPISLLMPLFRILCYDCSLRKEPILRSCSLIREFHQNSIFSPPGINSVGFPLSCKFWFLRIFFCPASLVMY